MGVRAQSHFPGGLRCSGPRAGPVAAQPVRCGDAAEVGHIAGPRGDPLDHCQTSSEQIRGPLPQRQRTARVDQGGYRASDSMHIGAAAGRGGRFGRGSWAKEGRKSESGLRPFKAGKNSAGAVKLYGAR